MRLPSAACGDPHTSRARLSETIATSRSSFKIGPRVSRVPRRSACRTCETNRARSPSPAGWAARPGRRAACPRERGPRSSDRRVHRQPRRERHRGHAGKGGDLVEHVPLQCASRASRSAITLGGIVMVNACNVCGCANPGSTLRRAWKLRIIKPEPTSSTSASATCTATSAYCDRCRSRVRLMPRVPTPMAPTNRGPKYFAIGNEAEAAHRTAA